MNLSSKLPKNSWILKEVSDRHGIPVELISAIIEVESGWRPWANRYEKGYKYLVDYAGAFCSPDTEKVNQQTSWGLMQIMGGTARDIGFQEPFLTRLCDPETGLEWSCKYLRRLYDRHQTWSDAVSAYNQGWPHRNQDGKYKNQGYVDKVTKAVERYQDERDMDGD